jgi:hypothetical protein
MCAACPAAHDDLRSDGEDAVAAVAAADVLLRLQDS